MPHWTVWAFTYWRHDPLFYFMLAFEAFSLIQLADIGLGALIQRVRA